MKLGVVSRIGEFPEEEWRKEFKIFGKNKEKANHLELISNYPYFGPLDYTRKQGGILKRYVEKNRLELIIHLLPNQRGLSKQLSKNIFSSEEYAKEFIKHEEKNQEIFNIGSLNESVRKQSVYEILTSLKIARD